MNDRRDRTFILYSGDTNYFSWGPVGLFFAAYFGAYFGAAVLAPVIYWMIQILPGAGDPGSTLEYLQGQSFTRYVDRVRMVFTVIFLVMLIRHAGLWGRFGFHWSRHGMRSLSLFLIIGFLSMCGIILGQWVFTGWVFRNGYSASFLGNVLVVSLAGALVLGWLEEAVFRGVLFRMFYTATRPYPAIILSAIVFAGVHFKKVPWLNDIGVEWHTGFYVASLQSVSFLLTLEGLVFWNYLLVGIVLNLIFLRTRSLVGCMGIHAGWVLARNFWRKLVDVPSEGTNLFWGTERIVDGFACFLTLFLLGVIFYVLWRRDQEKKPPVADVAA